MNTGSLTQLFLLNLEVNLSQIVPLNFEKTLQDDLVTDLSCLLAEIRLERCLKIGLKPFDSVLQTKFLDFKISKSQSFIHFCAHGNPPVTPGLYSYYRPFSSKAE